MIKMINKVVFFSHLFLCFFLEMILIFERKINKKYQRIKLCFNKNVNV
jgi:hypothetical protein